LNGSHQGLKHNLVTGNWEYAQLWEHKLINVQNGVPSTNNTLTPNDDSRWSAISPVPYQDKIYYLYDYYNTLEIKTVDRQGTLPNASIITVKTTDYGGEIDAFDVGQKTGKLLMLDYDGSAGQGGIWTADKDGTGGAWVKYLTGTGYTEDIVGSSEIFWSPDESRFALKGKYDNGSTTMDYLWVYDAATGLVLGSYSAGFSNLHLTLHGWSPDGNWLLFSGYFSSNSSQVTLAKVMIKPDGTFDASTEVDILKNVPLTSATWARLVPAANFRWNLYLPAILHARRRH